MSLVARHKKPGGFKKLVHSLEITPLDKRTLIIDSLKKEDQKFMADVEKAIFEFEEFKQLQDGVITDVIFKMKDNMRIVAVALFNCKDEELLVKFTKNMLHPQAAAFKEETKSLSQVSVKEQCGARFHIIAKARELQSSGVVTIKRYVSVYAAD